MDKDEEIKLELAKNRGWVNRLLAGINKMDRRCRDMLMSNSKRPVTDYCEKCQIILKNAMEGKK